MTAPGYVPDAGDVVWLEFDPQAGREQGGRRPAVVLSPASYNRRAGLVICCPTTTRIKGYPFEVLIAGQPASAVLADHVKSQDWRARKAALKGRITPTELARVRERLKGLIG